MTRRSFFAVLLPTAATRKRMSVCAAAANFAPAYNGWIAELNQIRPGTVNAREMTAWERLPDLFRDLERARRDWILGLRTR